LIAFEISMLLLTKSRFISEADAQNLQCATKQWKIKLEIIFSAKSTPLLDIPTNQEGDGCF